MMVSWALLMELKVVEHLNTDKQGPRLFYCPQTTKHEENTTYHCIYNNNGRVCNVAEPTSLDGKTA